MQTPRTQSIPRETSFFSPAWYEGVHLDADQQRLMLPHAKWMLCRSHFCSRKLQRHEIPVVLFSDGAHPTKKGNDSYLCIFMITWNAVGMNQIGQKHSLKCSWIYRSESCVLVICLEKSMNSPPRADVCNFVSIACQVDLLGDLETQPTQQGQVQTCDSGSARARCVYLFQGPCQAWPHYQKPPDPILLLLVLPPWKFFFASQVYDSLRLQFWGLALQANMLDFWERSQLVRWRPREVAISRRSEVTGCHWCCFICS